MARRRKRNELSATEAPRARAGFDRRELLFPVALTVFGALAFLISLDNQFLWQDEAQTALIAETVMERGLPYGTDGRNSFSQELGAEYGEDHLWRWHTWLPFYLVAGSFELFGVDTFAARLPFALFGLGTVLLLYFYVLELARSRPAAMAAAVLLLGNVPFLILSRQCRYYSVTAFFSLLGLYAYRRMIEGRRGAIAWFVFAAFLLFHTHYVYTATLLASAAIHCLLLARERVRDVAIACASTVGLCLPWIVWLAGMQYGEAYGEVMRDPAQTFRKGLAFADQIGSHVFPIYLLLIPIVVWALARAMKRPAVSFEQQDLRAFAAPLLFVLVTWAALAIATPHSFFRYLSPLIPPVLGLAGILGATAARLHPLATVAAIAPALFLQPIPDFVYELTHDYDGPIEGIVEYLNEHAEPDDVVAITYGDLPIKFYTDLRVVGGLTGEDLEPALDARWVIFRRHVVSRKDRAVRDYLRRHIDVRRYRGIEIDYPDVMFENRESPTEHRYRTSTNRHRVMIGERIGP